MFKAMLFDLDGTIGDTLPLCIAAFRAAIEPLSGKKLKDADIIATFGPSEEGTIMAFIPDQYDRGVEAYIDNYRKLHDMCPEPFPGMRETLDFLKGRGVFLAMVTGKGRRSADITLERFALGDYFADVGVGDPKGECKALRITEILDKRGIAPADAVYVGDTPSDIMSARKAGVAVFSAAWAGTADIPALEELGPDKIFTSVAEFRRYLGDMLS